LEIYKSNADLSRRAITYHLAGLSFREFLTFESRSQFSLITLNELLDKHQTIAGEIISGGIKILPEFKRYLEYGYYPFYKEGIKSYSLRLQHVVNTILENDLPAVEHIEYITIQKIKRMLMIISSLVPFSPNITKLSSEIESNRNTTIKYLGYLQKGGLIKMYLSSQKGMSLMNKPDKIYLDNTNLLFALSSSTVNEGNIRETFFSNQLNVSHSLHTAEQGDFQIDSKYTIEIGGVGKGFNQIKDVRDSYIAADNIETGYGNKIPLWLFGFLY
jgi:predicted AAA+ superfamily ATPase